MWTSPAFCSSNFPWVLPDFTDCNVCVYTFLCHLKLIFVINFCCLYACFLDRGSSSSQCSSSSSRTSTTTNKKPQSTLMSQIGADLNRFDEMKCLTCFSPALTYVSHLGCDSWFVTCIYSAGLSWDLQLLHRQTEQHCSTTTCVQPCSNTFPTNSTTAAKWWCHNDVMRVARCLWTGHTFRGLLISHSWRIVVAFLFMHGCHWLEGGVVCKSLIPGVF